MQPIYFGKAGKQLFGAYHLPRGRRRAVDAGVLLCYPGVQEYMRTHWAFRKLASLLVREGFHVLRFDYHGTGDSAGTGDQGRVAQWCADIRSAAAELQDLGSVSRVSVVGLRLGAALAALTAHDGLEVRDLVLWEPAIDGRSHIRELESIQRISFGSFAHPPVTGPEELLEHPFPDELRAGVERIDLRAIGRCPADRILLFASKPRAEHEQLRATLRDRTGRDLEYRIVPEEMGDRQEGILLSTRVLRAIAASISAGAS